MLTSESEVTASLVKDHWDVVRVVAERLFDEGTLDGNVVRSLVRPDSAG